jgi:hypothetical protein
MEKHRRPLLLLAFAAFLTPHEGLSKSRTMLPGWGPFRFGMTVVEAVSAAQGVAGENAKFAPAGFVTYETMVDGQTFNVSAYFSGIIPKLSDIKLEPMGTGGNEDVQSCLNVKASIASKLSSTYGPPDEDDGQPASNGDKELSASTIFNFQDGARIEAKARYTAYPYTPSKHLCVVTVIYSAPQAQTPESKF